MTAFVVNDERVKRFVTESNGLSGHSIHSSIGVERDGEIVAGVVFCDVTKTNCFMHVASRPGVNWVTRAFLRYVFGFPFDGLKVKRITALVPETNTKALRFDRHLGFKDEAVLPDIFPDGGLVVLSMRREQCRYV